MSNILILEGVYYPKPEANAICSYKIAQQLIKNGHKVSVICYKNFDLDNENINGIEVHRIKSRMFFRLRFFGEKFKDKWYGKIVLKFAYFCNKIKILMRYNKFPFMSPMLTKSYVKKFEEINEKGNFDMVISVYNPFETCYAGAKIKTKYPQIKHVLYVVDTLTNTGYKKGFSKKKLEANGWKWEQYLYERADLILNVKCHEEHHNNQRYDKYRNKMEFIDIPFMTKPMFNEKNIIDKYLNKSKINGVYAGAFTCETNPNYCVDSILQISNLEIEMSFFSRGNFQKYLLNKSKESDMINSNGFIVHDEMINVLQDVDFFVSIGRVGTQMIISKIFEYMSYGKPIIHFYKTDYDSSIKYYKNYSLALCIDERKQSTIESAKLIEEFLTENIKKKLKYEDIVKDFKENTPEYTVNYIENLLSK
ncbi:MAG: hypothetical protein WCR54_06050 [Clostridia bacterium]